MKTIVITGASSGIGLALAKHMDLPHHHLVLCGRNQKNLEELSPHLKHSHEIKIFDVKDKEQVFAQLSSLSEIHVLVNNAGNAHGLDTFDQMPLADMEEMILANVLGLIYVTKACMPGLIKAQHAQIINISSIAGKETYKNGTVYCASKAAVEVLSKGLRLDLLDKGVRVTNIAPGAVNTNFSTVRFKGDSHKADQVYAGFEPLLADDIALQIKAVIDLPHHVQIADITIQPSAQASATSILRG